MYLRYRRVEEELDWVALGCWYAPLFAMETHCFPPDPVHVLGEHLLQQLLFLPFEMEKENGDGSQSRTRPFAQFSLNPHLLHRGPMAAADGFGSHPSLSLLALCRRRRTQAAAHMRDPQEGFQGLKGCPHVPARLTVMAHCSASGWEGTEGADTLGVSVTLIFSPTVELLSIPVESVRNPPSQRLSPSAPCKCSITSFCVIFAWGHLGTVGTWLGRAAGPLVC